MLDVRLINANELLRVIDEEIEYGAEYAAKDYQLINKGLKIARKDIKCAPTIDAQPVKHGKWVRVKTVNSIVHIAGTHRSGMMISSAQTAEQRWTEVLGNV